MIQIFYFALSPSNASELVPNPEIFVIETSGTMAEFDPSSNYESFGTGINEQICETLVDFKSDSGDLIGQLATNWTISEDRLEYNFTVRQGVTFSNGDPFNAWVMKYSIDRTHIINDPSGPAWLTAEVVKGASGNQLLDLRDVNISEAKAYLTAGGVQVLDEFTLQITLEHNYAPFIRILTSRSMCAVSPKWIIENAPASYTTDGNNVTSQVPLSFMLPTLSDPTKLGLIANHDMNVSGVVPSGYHGSSAEHTYYGTNAIGTGPYKVKTVATGEITLEENTAWWNNGARNPGAPKEITYTTVDEFATMLLDLQSGTADRVSLNSATRIEVIVNDDGLITKPFTPIDNRFEVYETNRFVVHTIIFNLNDSLPVTALDEDTSSSTYNATDMAKFGYSGSPEASQENPFTSVLFREAFARSVDVNSLIEVTQNGLGRQPSGVIPAGMFGHVPNLVEDGYIPEFSPDTAKTIFESVGWEGSITVGNNAGSSTRLQTSLALKSVIDDLGVGITINVVEYTWPTFIECCCYHYLYCSSEPSMGLYSLGWGADFPDPHDFIRAFYDGSGGRFAQDLKYNNSLVNTMIDQAVIETDPENRKELYHIIEQTATKDYPMIYFLQPVGTAVMRSWINDFETSGSLNPARSEWRFAYLAKKTTWEGLITEPISSSNTEMILSETTHIESTYSTELLNDQTKEPPKGLQFLVIDIIRNLIPFMFAGSAGSMGGKGLAIMIRRIK
jgi:ABC-type transport system substrate-binding protein